MLLEKYKPTAISGIIGNKSSIQSLASWLMTWSSTSTQQMAALVSGPIGIGKTLAIDLVIKKSGDYNIIELNPDDERTATYINSRIKPILKNSKTMFGLQNILVINDIDFASDYGFIGAIVECIKETKIPIICVCNDRYNQKLKTLTNYCLDVRFQRPSIVEITKFIEDIVKKEKIKISSTNLKELIETSNNDIRNAILNLEFNAISTDNPPVNTTLATQKKDTTQRNMFDVVTDFLSQFTSLNDKFDLYKLESEMMPFMVHENYPTTIIKSKDIVETLDNLDKAAKGMSDYDIMNYDPTPLVITSAMCHPKTRINFTSYLGKMSTRTKKTTIINEISLKRNQPAMEFRMDYIGPLLQIIYSNIQNPKALVDFSTRQYLSKEDIQDNLDLLFIKTEPYNTFEYAAIDRKQKTAITKQFNSITEMKPQPSSKKTITKSPKATTKKTNKETNKTILDYTMPKEPLKEDLPSGNTTVKKSRMKKITTNNNSETQTFPLNETNVIISSNSIQETNKVVPSGNITVKKSRMKKIES
jgi:replication factor C subunit 1